MASMGTLAGEVTINIDLKEKTFWNNIYFVGDIFYCKIYRDVENQSGSNP